MQMSSIRREPHQLVYSKASSRVRRKRTERRGILLQASLDPSWAPWVCAAVPAPEENSRTRGVAAGVGEYFIPEALCLELTIIEHGNSKLSVLVASTGLPQCTEGFVFSQKTSL